MACAEPSTSVLRDRHDVIESSIFVIFDDHDSTDAVAQHGRFDLVVLHEVTDLVLHVGSSNRMREAMASHISLLVVVSHTTSLGANSQP